MIDAAKLKDVLLSGQYRCPDCDDGQIGAGMQPDDPSRGGDPEADYTFVVETPCTNGCQVEPGTSGYDHLCGAFFARQEVYALLFPTCHCDDPPFMRDL